MKKNNKTFTESINNLLLENTTTNKTLLDHSTRKRNILSGNQEDINKEIEKPQRLHYQIYRLQQLYSYQKALINRERLYVQSKV